MGNEYAQWGQPERPNEPTPCPVRPNFWEWGCLPEKARLHYEAQISLYLYESSSQRQWEYWTNLRLMCMQRKRGGPDDGKWIRGIPPFAS